MSSRDFSRMSQSAPQGSMMDTRPFGTGAASTSVVLPPSLAGMMQGMRLPINPMTCPESKPVDSGSSQSGSLGVSAPPKKRGRPRKYPAGALALSPLSPASGYSARPISMPGARKRGRPPGSRKKQQLDALGSPGAGFTPHVIKVNAGEDVASKIMDFSQQGPRTVCVLSANGAISNATIRQAVTSGGTVTYEGRYEILSLSGSYMLTDNDGTPSRTGGLSVSLAASDGRVLGGGVAGMLRAATHVQVIVGSFIPDKKKRKPATPSPEPSQLPALGAASAARSPSQGTPSESADDSGGSGSPIDDSGGSGNRYSPGQHGMHAYLSAANWPHTGNQARLDPHMKLTP